MQIVTEDGLMRERMKLEHGRIYSGGSAAMVGLGFRVWGLGLRPHHSGGSAAMVEKSGLANYR
jgi:hypothetical protein